MKTLVLLCCLCAGCARHEPEPQSFWETTTIERGSETVTITRESNSPLTPLFPLQP